MLYILVYFSDGGLCQYLFYRGLQRTELIDIGPFATATSPVNICPWCVSGS